MPSRQHSSLERLCACEVEETGRMIDLFICISMALRVKKIFKMLPVPVKKHHHKCSWCVGTIGWEGAQQGDRTASGRLFWHTEAPSQSFSAAAHSPLRAWGNIERRRRKCEITELMYSYAPVPVEEKIINLYFAPFLFAFPDHVLCSQQQQQLPLDSLNDRSRLSDR